MTSFPFPDKIFNSQTCDSSVCSNIALSVNIFPSDLNLSLNAVILEFIGHVSIPIPFVAMCIITTCMSPRKMLRFSDFS